MKKTAKFLIAILLVISIAKISNAQPIPFGVYGLPATQWGQPYNVVIKKPATLKQLGSVLKNCANAGVKVILILGTVSYNADSSFNLQAWKNQVSVFAGFDFTPYENIVLGNYIIDEPFDSTNWGGQVVPFDVLDSACSYSHQLFPNVRTIIRSSPWWLRLNPNPWVALDVAWLQYHYWLGNSLEWRNQQIAHAEEMGIKLMTGLNVLNGGDGSSGIPGSEASRWEMTPSEIREYGKNMLIPSPVLLGFFFWKYDEAFFNRPEVINAVNYLYNYATNR